MTLEELLNHLRGLHSLDLDNVDGLEPSNDALIRQINWAQRSIAKRIKPFDPSVTLTLTTGQMGYSLSSTAFSKRMIGVTSVYLDGVPLFRSLGDRSGLWSYSELERDRPYWRNLANGTPEIALQTDTSCLYLIPAPDAAASAKSCKVSGFVYPADLTSASLESSIDLPLELHECVAYLAAVRAAMPVCTEEEAWRRVNAYEKIWSEVAAEIAHENANISAPWGSTQYGSLSPFGEEMLA